MKNQNKSRVDQSHTNTERPARIPMSAGNKLQVPDSLKKEGYQQYWQVDKDGAIEQMERAWWEKVTNERNEHITTPAGNGNTLFLMQIEQAYYDEDIKKQQDLNIATSTNQAQNLGENEYVPKGQDHVVSRERDIV